MTYFFEFCRQSNNNAGPKIIDEGRTAGLVSKMPLANRKKSREIAPEDIRQFLLSIAPAYEGKIDLDTDIVGGGLLDSVAMMELLLWLEKDRDVRIDDRDLLPENFRSINVLHSFILNSGN